MKTIEPYLPFYIGAKALYFWPNGQSCELEITALGIAYWNKCGYSVKPVLRPLSSMTEEEAIEYLKMKYNACDVSGAKKNENGFWFDLSNGSTKISTKFIFFGEIKDQSYPEQFTYLLSKGFDLFGLIESNLAVASNK